MTILEELYYGNICPTDDILLPNSKTNQMLVLLDRHKQTVENSLNMEQKTAFLKLNDCREELSQLVECEAFVQGFSLATKIITQAMLTRSQNDKN